jgi:hypothetical protein
MKKCNEEIEEYLNKNIKLYNEFFKKIEILFNDYIIEGIKLEIESTKWNINSKIITIYTIDYTNNIIEYKDNQTTEEKNLLINIKSKRAELINKLLIKNYKNIKKLELTLLKNAIDKNIICPLVDLNKFDNLISLDLYILDTNEYNEEKPYIFKFNYNLKKLRNSRIELSPDYQNSYLYIQKEILNRLNSLKVIHTNWFILNTERFNFNNIKELLIECYIPKKNEFHISKKFFLKNFLIIILILKN